MSALPPHCEALCVSLHFSGCVSVRAKSQGGERIASALHTTTTPALRSRIQKQKAHDHTAYRLRLSERGAGPRLQPDPAGDGYFGYTTGSYNHQLSSMW